jgi:hypothetical protein
MTGASDLAIGAGAASGLRGRGLVRQWLQLGLEVGHERLGLAVNVVGLGDARLGDQFAGHVDGRVGVDDPPPARGDDVVQRLADGGLGRRPIDHDGLDVRGGLPALLAQGLSGDGVAHQFGRVQQEAAARRRDGVLGILAVVHHAHLRAQVLVGTRGLPLAVGGAGCAREGLLACGGIGRPGAVQPLVASGHDQRVRSRPHGEGVQALPHGVHDLLLLVLALGSAGHDVDLGGV